jgi:transposase
MRPLVDVALKSLSPAFDEMYSALGRPSIAPEKLLKALLLQVLYNIRSERLLMEQLGYNLLFRWFVGLNMDESVWVLTVYRNNRDRLLEGNVAVKFFAEVLDQARAADLLSEAHFSVDGTLIEAWAGQERFQRRDGGDQRPKDDPGNPTVDFHGEKRSNDTHESTTDADARLARKSGGHETKLAYCGNIIIENRHGLVVDTERLPCNGTAERDAAILLAERLEGSERVTLGGDKGYGTKDFVKEMRGMNVTAHVAQNLKRAGGSAIDGRDAAEDPAPRRIQSWAIINLTNQRQFAKTVADVTGRAVHQCGLFAARFFSCWRFSRLSARIRASFGTVSTLRKAMSKRSAGVPPSGRSAGGGNRIRPHHTAVSDFMAYDDDFTAATVTVVRAFRSFVEKYGLHQNPADLSSQPEEKTRPPQEPASILPR